MNIREIQLRTLQHGARRRVHYRNPESKGTKSLCTFVTAPKICREEVNALANRQKLGRGALKNEN